MSQASKETYTVRFTGEEVGILLCLLPKVTVAATKTKGETEQRLGLIATITSQVLCSRLQGALDDGPDESQRKMRPSRRPTR